MKKTLMVKRRGLCRGWGWA